MASCLVPDFPAVMVALEHLKELDKHLQGEEVPFSPEASLHLKEITAAITELEAHSRAAHEHLEVETIENSKLRHQINNIRERMSQEIMADVAAARALNAEEMEQLQKDVSAVTQQQEAAVRRQETLLKQNQELSPEREQVKAEHEKVIAAQNDQITLKYGLQRQLDQTRDRIDELKSRVAAVEQDIMSLQQKRELEIEAFTVKKDNLTRDVAQVEEKIKQQDQSIARIRVELDGLNSKRQEAQDILREDMVDLAKLEGNVRRLAATRCQCEQQLHGEKQKHQELKQQRETLKKELRDLQEAFSVAVRQFKEEIASVEGKTEEGRVSRLLWQESLAQIYETFKHQHTEEDEVRTEFLQVSEQLERSRLQLEERIASIVRHRMEIKEMDKEIRKLLETDTITKRVLERNQEELSENMDMEKKNVSHLEEEKRRLARLLEESKRKQEEHQAKMTSDISGVREKYRKLQLEEAALHELQPKSVNADLLMSHVTQCEVQYRQKEFKHHEEIKQRTAETVSITRSREEKLREAEEKEEILKELEEKWNEEKCRHQTLKTLMSDLNGKRNGLELSIEDLKAKTDSLLQPKEEMKAELGEMRRSYMDTLAKQASELRATETSIYDNSVKLEQVRLENSRLRLCIRQMTEEAGSARENKERYWQEGRRIKRDIKTLLESLQEARREDSALTQDCQERDGALLEAMSGVLSHLETRRQQLGHVSTLLHQHMLDFSKRLGDKVVEQQS